MGDATRRDVLAGLGAGLGAAALGCGDNAHPSAATSDAQPDAVPDAAITACTATSALSPAELLAGIETIVVLCMENRSFDHYLGSLRVVEGRADIDGLRGTESNPSSSGGQVAVHPLQSYQIADPPHEWADCHTQWDNGANDGFVISHTGVNEQDVMGYFVRADLPVTYALADAAAICERWHAAVMGPTWPNRFHIHCATSSGEMGGIPVLGLTSIWDRLKDAGVAGLNYYSDVPWALGAIGKTTGLALIDRFFTDAAAGTLPPFSVIDPQFFNSGANDDHPAHDVQLGQALIGTIVAALGASPQWNKCLFVLTYDEHGGFYDHVPPPMLPPGIEPYSGFEQLGFRVPTLVLGPTVRRGCAITTPFEHVSIAATVTKRFGLVPLNARCAAAQDLSPCIDPRLIGQPQPPPTLPRVAISRAKLEARLARAPTVVHHELADALAARPAPEIDRRADGNAITRRVLEIGERLGAVRLVD